MRWDDLAHRVFLPPSAQTRVFEEPSPAFRFHACVDFRFVEFADELVLQAISSLWSDLPGSLWHCPHGPGEPPSPTDLSVLDWSRHLWYRAQPQIQKFLESFFETAEPSVFGRPHRPPTFWMIAPACPAGAAGVPHPLTSRGQLSLPRTTAGGDSEDRGVAAGVLSGDLLTFRRAIVGGDHDRNAYLILPARPRRTAGSCGDEAHSPLVDQEEAVAHTVFDLSLLERSVMESLFETQAHFDVWRTHLRMYQRSAEEANGLWDALATHLLLPDRTQWRSLRNHLGNVERSVSLLHQALVQGSQIWSPSRLGSPIGGTPSRIGPTMWRDTSTSGCPRPTSVITTRFVGPSVVAARCQEWRQKRRSCTKSRSRSRPTTGTSSERSRTRSTADA